MLLDRGILYILQRLGGASWGRPRGVAHRDGPDVALNDATHFGGPTVAFGEQRTCAAEARGPHSTRLTHFDTSVRRIAAAQKRHLDPIPAVANSCCNKNCKSAPTPRGAAMRRRDFIKVIAGSATAWPLAAHAQPAEKMRRIGALIGYAEGDPIAKSRVAAFAQGLQQLGWTEGRNLQIEYRFAPGNVDQMRTFAKELVALGPDCILTNTTPVTAAVKRETQTIPIVFNVVSDPVGSGFVKSLAEPGGNITGFINVEASMATKWVELLREVVPGVKRIALIFNPDTAPYAQYFVGPFERATRTIGAEAQTAPVHNDSEIEQTIASIGSQSDGGLITMPDGFMLVHRESISTFAARYRVPVVSGVSDKGGLVSYTADGNDLFKRSAEYVDRILRGAKPSELPVQLPTKFELVINVKTAKAIGLSIPQTLAATADNIIE
jgi:putative ABC transport system substrate-binding protein